MKYLVLLNLTNTDYLSSSTYTPTSHLTTKRFGDFFEGNVDASTNTNTHRHTHCYMFLYRTTEEARKRKQVKTDAAKKEGKLESETPFCSPKSG